MSPPSSSGEQNTHTYVIDAENPAELARLMHQDRLYTKVLGRLPEPLNSLSPHTILDIACGPGGWALDFAQAFPSTQVTGIDISSRMIQYARTQAEVHAMPNVHFTVMNALEPLTFADDSFDLVHARLISGFMPNASWSHLLKEIWRITRPGGFICMTECEWGVTNGPVSQKLSLLLAQALHATNQSFSPDGLLLGITPVLKRLVCDTGYQNVQGQANYFDYSSDSDLHEPFYQNIMAVFKLLQPFLTKWGGTTQEDLDHLYQQLPAEMLAETFCAVWFFLTIWGDKPEPAMFSPT